MDQVALQSHIECLVNYRFANEKLADSVIRVALQPLRKLDPKERMVGLIRLLQKHNLPTVPVSRIIGAALHYFDPEDAQCIQMKEMISVSGPGVVLKEICKITEKERCFNECLEFYQEFTS
jgi:mannitol-1-phosphate 5-dehydrogenase